MDTRWQPRPSYEPPVPPAGASTPVWREERLFDQRIVMVRGALTQQDATSIAAALLTLDATGPAPIQLHLASNDGQLLAAHAIIDVIESMTDPVHAVVTPEAGGAVLAVLSACDKRSAYRHARFR